MKLLHILSSVNPDGGGPTEGVRQRGIRLVEMGHRVEVVSLDDPGAPFLADFPLQVHAVGPPRGRYRYSDKLVSWLLEHARDYDAIVINGLWQYNSFGAWRALHRLRIPYFVFTHGMLDPWFKTEYPLKHLKKWLYWPWADYRVLRDARAVLFTSQEELLQARKSFWLYRAREQVVAYGTRTPPQDAQALREKFLAAQPHLRGARVLLFLSRIHEKKGCDLLVRAFATLSAADPALQLVIAGPDQTGWVATLKALAQQLGIAQRITWPGMLRDDMKWGAFYAAEAFVLPSHQENFGIAVAEALGCGLPALISDKVNIWREVASSQAGLVAPDTLAGTVQLLGTWQSMSTAERTAMGAAARALFHRSYTVDAMAQGLLEVVRNDALAAGAAA
jgi:glycosyltransferase involved in cell wall biosynthesis